MRKITGEGEVRQGREGSGREGEEEADGKGRIR